MNKELCDEYDQLCEEFIPMRKDSEENRHLYLAQSISDLILKRYVEWDAKQKADPNGPGIRGTGCESPNPAKVTYSKDGKIMFYGG